MKNYLIFSCFLLFSTSFLHAQSSMDEMLDDGTAGKERLLLKINPAAMLIGDFPLYAEVRLTKRLSVEAGAGFQAGYFLNEWFYYLSDENPWVTESDEALEPGSGYSLRVAPKYYISGGYLQGFAIGAMWRKRQYGIKGSDDHVGFTDHCLLISQQVAVRKGVWVDYYLGIGYRSFQFPEDKTIAYGISNIVMPWGIKLGYGF